MKRLFILVALAAVVAGSASGRPRAHIAGGLGYQVLRNVNSWMCIGVQHGSTRLGVAIRQGRCNHRDDQTWRIVATGGFLGYWTLQNYHSRLCMDFSRNRYGNGTPIIQWNCNPNDAAQQFALDSSSTPPGHDEWFVMDHSRVRVWGGASGHTRSGHCVAVPGGTRRPANLVEWDCPQGSRYANNYWWWATPGNDRYNGNPHVHYAKDRGK